MSPSGDTDLLIASRRVLLDALEALRPHLNAVVVVGAQAIYMHTGAAPVALAETTKDSDLALDSRVLNDSPLLEEAMASAGFQHDLGSSQPGSWLSPTGIPVDLLIPESLAGSSGRRGVRIPPHANHAARRVTGLEAAVVDHAPMTVHSLAADDKRAYTVNVANPAALLIAKLHKLGDRQQSPGRLHDKDAHDIYRLLIAVPTDDLALALRRLRADELAGAATDAALVLLANLFANGSSSTGSQMAGRAEEGIGDPEVVSASATTLASDLLEAMS
jgi:nucleotidyltransferase-like protein